MLITKKFFQLIKQGKFKAVVSTIVDKEIEQAPLKKQELLKKLIKDYSRLQATDRVRELAEEYLKCRIIPKKVSNDAYHLAIVTVWQIKVLVSWNFKHLVNPKTKELVNQVNSQKGYSNIQIITPEELVNLYA